MYILKIDKAQAIECSKEETLYGVLYTALNLSKYGKCSVRVFKEDNEIAYFPHVPARVTHERKRRDMVERQVI